MKFFYKMQSPKGDVKSGEVEAENKQEALTKLQSMGFTVISLSENSGKDKHKKVGKKRKWPKKRLIFFGLNLLVLLYMLFGSFTVKGRLAAGLSEMLYRKYNVKLRFNALRFNLSKCQFEKFSVTGPRGDKSTADTLKISCNLKSVFLGSSLDIVIEGKNVRFLSPRRILFDTDNISAEGLHISFQMDKSGKIAGEGRVVLKGLASVGEKSLLRPFGEMFDVKYIKQLHVNETSVDISLLQSRLSFTDIALDNTDFYLYGKGHYLLGQTMNIGMTMKFIPESKIGKVSNRTEWNTISFALQGPVHAPKIEINQAKVDMNAHAFQK